MGEKAAADPDREATAAPESASAPPVAHAVGVGPGDPALLTDLARTLLEAADVVVGFETVLDVVRDATDGTLLSCGYDDQQDVLRTFGDRVASGETGVAVLMGDPNVSGYQFLGRVEKAVDGPVRVVPGISSIQAAASRAETPLEHSTIVSLHRRGYLDAALDRLARDVADDHFICLPRPYDWMPEDVAAHLRDAGAPADLAALVYEHLTMADETITRTDLEDLAADAGGEDPGSSRFSDLSVLVVRAPRPQPVSDGAAEGAT